MLIDCLNYHIEPAVYEAFSTELSTTNQVFKILHDQQSNSLTFGKKSVLSDFSLTSGNPDITMAKIKQDEEGLIKPSEPSLITTTLQLFYENKRKKTRVNVNLDIFFFFYFDQLQ